MTGDNPVFDELEKKTAELGGQGRAEDAERLLLAALKRSPKSVRLHLGLARARELQGDYDGAHAACARAVALDPKFIQARGRLQIFEEILGLERESRASAEAAYELTVRSLRREEPSQKALLQAASLAADLGKFADYERHLLAAFKLDPSSRAVILKLGTLALWSWRAAQARTLAFRARRRDRPDPDSLTLAGAAAASRGRLQEALKSLNAALTADPEHLLAMVWRGETLLRLGRAKAALADLSRAVGRTDNGLGPNILHSLASLAVGRTQAAWSLVCVARRLPERLLRLAPEIRSGEPRRMERALRAALKTLGGNRSAACVWLTGAGARRKLEAYRVSDVADRMEILQRGLYRQSPKRVLATLKSRLAAGESPGWVHAFLGETRLWLGDGDGAERDFHRALEAEPDMRWPHVGLALTALFRGRPEETLEHCRTAEASDAPPRSWLAARGEALRRLGRPAEAARDLEAALRISPERISAWFNLVLARLDEGKTAEARALYGRLAGWAPQYLVRSARRAGVASESALALTDERQIRLALTAGLELMGGNRSSWLQLYAEKDGRLRAIHFSFSPFEGWD